MSDRISLFLKKLEDNPSNLLNRFSLSQAYFEDGNYKDAIVQLEMCVEGREDWMMAYLLLAKSYIANEQESLAIKSLQHTIQLAQDQSHEDPELEAKNLLSQLDSSMA